MFVEETVGNVIIKNMGLLEGIHLYDFYWHSFTHFVPTAPAEKKYVCNRNDTEQ